MGAPPNSPSIQSICVYVGLDLVGDGLMKLPFVRALRAAFPRAHITWLAGKGRSVYAGSLAPLVSGLIDEVIDNADIGSRWWELLRRPLHDRFFDLVIDTQRRVLTTLIVKRLPHRLFLSGTAHYLFSDLAPKVGLHKPEAMIHQMLDLVEVASGRPARPDAPLPIDPAAEAQADSLLPLGGSYIGLAPGAGGKHKCWPLENYIALAMRQVKAGRTPVVFLGPEERQWEDEVRDALPTAILPLDHRATPLLTIALARRLRLAVANDSGAGHMMAAAGVPLISLFGPTAPEKFAPVTPYPTLIRAQDFGGTTMDAIPLLPVAEAVERILRGE